MRRIRIVGMLAAMVLPAMLFAQSRPEIIVWKMNVEKSKFPGPHPQSLTRTSVTTSNVAKLSFEGIGPDGKRISYEYMTRFDEKDYPVTGAAPPATIETMSVKRIDSKTTETTGKKAGKTVLKATNVLSDDGSVLTTTSHGTDKNGQPTIQIAVWEKQ